MKPHLQIHVEAQEKTSSSPRCDGLTLPGCLRPTQPLSSSPSSSGQGTKQDGKAQRSRLRHFCYCHRPNRLDLVEANFIYCQFEWWETTTEVKPPSPHPTLNFFPRFQFSPSFPAPLLPLRWSTEGWAEHRCSFLVQLSVPRGCQGTPARCLQPLLSLPVLPRGSRAAFLPPQATPHLQYLFLIPSLSILSIFFLFS